jgi:hypothetical protein
MAVLGLAAYVGLRYALTSRPFSSRFRCRASIVVILPVTYGLLVWLWVRRPSITRWLVGTAVLSGLHVLLGMSREPLSALLDPALAGRSLPWVLPPPLPELIGVMLLLVPLRDVLRAPVRLARERGAGVGRPLPSHRARPAAAPRVQPAAAVEEGIPEREAAHPQRAGAGAGCHRRAGGGVGLLGPPRRLWRRSPGGGVTARAERRREAEPIRRADDRTWCCAHRARPDHRAASSGTFLAPEDEVAASLSDPGYLKISGQARGGPARKVWRGWRGPISRTSSHDI